MMSKNKNIKKKFEQFITRDGYPCMMARIVFKLDQAIFCTYDGFGSKKAATKLYQDLKNYSNDYDFNSPGYFSFIAAFPNNENFTELEFEEQLWKQLEVISKVDGKPWDPEVSSNPDDSNFSFSAAGHAFYVVGLHENSSRKARQAPCPTLVFNLHSQFEHLRDEEAYRKVKDKIRKRDKDFQGSINPMVEDFGKKSEARQYSGRKVEDDWNCPFHANKK